MAIQYTASIGSMSTLDEGGNNDVVKEAVYYLTAAEGNKSFTSMKTIRMGDVGGSFTAYDSLTESDVVGWCETIMGASEVTALLRGLEVQFTTPIAPAEPQDKQLPW